MSNTPLDELFDTAADLGVVLRDDAETIGDHDLGRCPCDGCDEDRAERRADGRRF
jgi:hypothetical protein